MIICSKETLSLSVSVSVSGVYRTFSINVTLNVSTTTIIIIIIIVLTTEYISYVVVWALYTQNGTVNTFHASKLIGAQVLIKSEDE